MCHGPSALVPVGRDHCCVSQPHSGAEGAEERLQVPVESWVLEALGRQWAPLVAAVAGRVLMAGRWLLTLHTSLLFDPGPKQREPCVHAGLVALSAAFSPAHHAGLEDPPIRLHTGQGAAGVALDRDRPA